MPRTGPRSSAHLAIELDNPHPIYFPGDTLKGHVVCEEPPQQQQAPYSAVRLKLYGRAKTKYTVQSQYGKANYRGRAVFFEETQLLHKEPMMREDRGGGAAAGAHAWFFSVTIPKTSQPGFATRKDCDEFGAESPFLHTRDAEKKKIDVTTHPLPSIMYYKSESGMSGKTVEAYIEYVLLAEAGDINAAYPLYVRQRSVPCPIQDFEMQTRTFQEVVKTPKLLPEYADAELTFRQRSRMLFRPSKTPRYGFTVKVEYPTVIQLEHPEPIPLKIYLVPDLDEKTTDICSNGDLSSLPPVQLVNMELKLKGDISVRCPGMWEMGTEKNHTFEINFREGLKAMDIPIGPMAELHEANSAPDIPSNGKNGAPLTTTDSTPPAAMNTWQNTEGTEVAYTSAGWRPLHPTTPTGSPFALDLGAHAAILLGSSASSTLSHPPVSFKRQLYPSFATYNIQIKYRLRWKLFLTCAGEEFNISGEAVVTVLPPSEEQEERKERELGSAGMKKNYDDLEAGVEQTVQFIGQILQAVS